MKKILLILVLLLTPSLAWAQCNGQFSNGQVCGVATGGPKLPGPIAATAFTPGLLPTPTRAGDVMYWNGSAWVTLAGNNSGSQVFTENASGVPSWSTAVVVTATRAGDVIYWNGSAWVNLAGNNSGTQYLQENSSGVPVWATAITSVTPGGGVVSSTTANCSQSAITLTGTLSKAECVNAQTGASYAIVDGDRGKLITASNVAAQAYTIAQAGAASAFVAGWLTDIQNIQTVANPAGIVTITPATSTIGGAANYKLYPGQGVRIVSDGTNYQVIPYSLGGGSWVLLNTVTASNSPSMQDITSMTAAFADYEIEFTAIVSATNAVTAQLTVHSAAAFQTTGYITAGQDVTSAASAAFLNPTTFVPIYETGSIGNTAANGGLAGYCKFFNVSSTTGKKPVICVTGAIDNTGTAYRTINSSGVWNGGNTATDGFQLIMSAGNITSGTIKVYGRL